MALFALKGSVIDGVEVLRALNHCFEVDQDMYVGRNRASALHRAHCTRRLLRFTALLHLMPDTVMSLGW